MLVTVNFLNLSVANFKKITAKKKSYLLKHLDITTIQTIKFFSSQNQHSK